MRRLLLVAVAVLLGGAAPHTPRAPAPPATLRFVIIGDRTGEARPAVFARAMDQINLLAPDLVFGVGDLIEGYIVDKAEAEHQWDAVASDLARLGTRFYPVVGNHDISNTAMREVWDRRWGDRAYAVRVKDVLFLMLDTEDPPPAAGPTRKELRAQDPARFARAVALLQGPPAVRDAALATDPALRVMADRIMGSDGVAIGAAQVAMVERALAANKDARWTFVLMHRPAWRYRSAEFGRIEAALSGRPHSLIAGHFHSYAYDKADGVGRIQMGTTGGTQSAGIGKPGTMDHILFVSMTADGPQIANIRLDGLYDKRGPQPETDGNP